MTPTIHSLRLQGFRVNINHYRFIGNPKKKHNLTSYFHIREQGWQSRITAKGGLTTVEVCDTDDKPVYNAEARCSRSDAFCRKAGLRICLERIEQQMNQSTQSTLASITL